MKTIILDGVEYELTPVEKATWVKQDIIKAIEWGPVSDELMTWEDAKDWCAKQGGRLPTAVELLSAYEDKMLGFPSLSLFWSATTYPSTVSQNSAMFVSFSYGLVSGSNKANSLYVRCVRDC